MSSFCICNPTIHGYINLLMQAWNETFYTEDPSGLTWTVG